MPKKISKEKKPTRVKKIEKIKAEPKPKTPKIKTKPKKVETKPKPKVVKAKPKAKPKKVEKKLRPKKKPRPLPETPKILGIVANYRLGMASQHCKEFLIRIQNVESEGEACKYIGRKAIWRSEGNKRIAGKVLGVHGKRGVLKARFRKGLPGQAIGTNVEII